MEVIEWLGKNNKLGMDIWKNKYCYENESFEEWLDRVSNGDLDIREDIKEKRFLFGGRILSNRGLHKRGRKVTYSNCYVVTPPEDNLESIFDTAKKLARTFSYGGGCGIDISLLRPKGSKVNNAAKYTSGAVSFMDLYSLTTEIIGQNGRRGALMISIDVEHPDIIEFTKVKSDLKRVTKANISIRVNERFMKAVERNESYEVEWDVCGEKVKHTIDAPSIWKELCYQNWNYAEPGILFWDNIENNNLLAQDKEFKYAGTNPCVVGETLILTDKGEIPIKDLIGKECNVWNGYDWSTVRPRVTGHDQELYKVSFSNGSEVICTPYHKWVIEYHEYRVETRNLNIGQQIKTYTLPDNKFCKGVTVTGIEKLDYKADIVYCMNEPYNHTFIANGIITGNCAEEPLPAGGSCLLGSIILPSFLNEKNGIFDFELLEQTVEHSVKSLDDVLEEGLPLHPLLEQRESVRDWRQIGLGILGLGDLLIKMGLKYGSKESFEFVEKVMDCIWIKAVDTSCKLAEEKGMYPKCKKDLFVNNKTELFNVLPNELKDRIYKYGLRNSQIMTCAPTGTLGTMLEMSTGIEPNFAFSYTRKTESLHGKDVYYEVYTKIAKEYIDKHKLNGINELPDYFISAQNINPIDRVKMQGIIQRYIDASISSTVNLVNSATVEDVSKLYVGAWKNGLKGMTVYRAGCAREGILTVEPKKEDKKIIDNTGVLRDTAEDTIYYPRTIHIGCGKIKLMIGYSHKEKAIQEFYVVKSGQGGCEKNLQAVAIYMSGIIRLGGNIDLLESSINGISSCPSFASKRAKGEYTSPGSSCPQAIIKAVKEFKKQMTEIGIGYPLSKPVIEKIKKEQENPKTEKTKIKCPECGAELEFSGGCVTCKHCGYSKCE